MEKLPAYNTLFLDRDGVINVHRPNDYVKAVEEFMFIDGTLDALKELSPLFRYIIIVTNQRGVGKGVMNRETLDNIHVWMMDKIKEKGGRIDKIYVCTDTDPESPDRKPNIGMALQAVKDYPDIDFAQSFLVGDSVSDIQFANRVGIPAIQVGNKIMPKDIPSLSLYARCKDLRTFVPLIKQNSFI